MGVHGDGRERGPGEQAASAPTNSGQVEHVQPGAGLRIGPVEGVRLDGPRACRLGRLPVQPRRTVTVLLPAGTPVSRT